MSDIQSQLFSFDIGTNSIGWAVLGLDARDEPATIIDAGVRIYSDGREPKSGTSLAEGRRVARGMSRRRDRYKRRRKAVLRTLTEFGLMPDTVDARKALVAETNDKTFDRIATDVYALRARALDEKLAPFHVGRALFHLNQRRGFKSNRKTDKRDNDQGKIASGISRLRGAMDQARARTLGEFLHGRRGGGHAVRVRPQPVTGKDDKEEVGYGFYPERSFLEAEFHAIWDAQSSHHPALLTEERREHLFKVMFFQRALKRPKIGKCSFNPDEDRLPKAHPLFQDFRLYKEVNELALVYPDLHSEKLTLEQRDALVKQLQSQREASFSALRKTIKAPHGSRFNKESEARLKMKGNEVAAELSSKTRFGQGWFDLSRDAQSAIIAQLRDIEDPLELQHWLEQNYSLTPEQYDAIAAAHLPEGYGRLGATALTEMLVELKADVIPEAEAAARAGYDHALLGKASAVDELPKYQEVLGRRIPPGTGAPDDPYDVQKGRITNPTVHIGLNQLQRVLNRLIARYGKPEQIAIELARDLKLSEEQKADVNRRIAKNTREAERRSDQLRALGQVDNGYNRLLLKLWEELDPAQPLNRLCVYSGKPIGIAMLFSAEIDVDHILPWSKTLDDSQANRILCLREANREKANHAPADVPQWQGRYDEILERANRLPLNKRWRFARDAMEKFKDEESFLARQLTDTQYLSRMAHEYLGALYDDEEPDEWGVFARKNHVRVIPGRMTEMLRRQWGLNSIISDHNHKNRNDHRHHAIDAAVVGVTTRSLLQRIATVAGGREALALEETIGKIEPPWENFRDDLKRVIDRIVVSHKPDHGSLPKAGQGGHTAGQLHNDTAYGFTYEDRDGERVIAEKNGVPIVVRSVPFMSLTEKDIGAIRDKPLADALFRAIRGLSGKDLATALEHFRADGPYKNIRHVRVTEVVSVVPIRDPSGHPYKGYASGGNYRFDVWELPDGKWDAEVVSMFDAHQPSFQSRMRLLHHNPRKIMSLTIGDMVAYESPETGQTIVARVRKFDQRNKQIYFDKHNEAGKLDERHADPDDSFRNFSKTPNALRGIKARQIRVDEIGRVFDPGPQDRDSRLARRQAGVTPATGAG